jgi:CRISPR-associated protein Csd2
MTQEILNDVNRRHDFVMLFDVTDGNPNGDPDAGNLPRVDPETMQGLVTDVCLKRKVRNYVDQNKGTEERNKIYVEHHGVLNLQHQRAYDNAKDKSGNPIKSKGSKQDRDTIKVARDWMCNNFYDIRLFGAVMTTGVNCGQVRGPMQLTFARSVDAVVPLDISITRVAVTRAEDSVTSEEGEGGKQTEMGRKALVPYGLYRGHGFFNPALGKDTGVTEEDLALFWKALREMWDIDRSASRGLMALRGLYVFSHESDKGNAPAHVLFETLTVKRRDGVMAPRAFEDYEVSILEGEVPAGVVLTRVVG